jgi:hypothetical protein
MKTNEQIVKEVVALMADTWLAACDRRVIGWAMDQKSNVVLELGRNGHGLLFGPASGAECRLFIHRAAALDVLRAVGTAQIADAATMVANASIREWGWTVPVLCDEHGGIIAGHGRVLAAKKLGLDTVPARLLARCTGCRSSPARPALAGDGAGFYFGSLAAVPLPGRTCR